MTFDLAISGEKKEKKEMKETMAEKEHDEEFRVHYELLRKSLCTQNIQ